MARRDNGREHLVTLALPLDLTTVAALAAAIESALAPLGWSDIRIHCGSHEVTATPRVAQHGSATIDEETSR